MKSSFSNAANLLAEHRVAQRAIFHRQGKLTEADGSIVQVKIIDISTSGVGLFSSHPLHPRKRCTLNIPTYRPELPEIILSGTVVYNILTGMQGYRVGIEFSGLDAKARSFITQIMAAAP